MIRRNRREEAMESATLVRECWRIWLGGDWISFHNPKLYGLDGAKALSAAVKRHAGQDAMIQRCQVHKRRNVVDQLPDEQQPATSGS
jgi:putative transposase